jgi:predicted CXXCH cytochrome family protein
MGRAWPAALLVGLLAGAGCSRESPADSAAHELAAAAGSAPPLQNATRTAHSAAGASSSPSELAARAEFVGSEACAGCHAEAYEDWRDSHHRHAMAPAAQHSVLGDFRDATFEYFGTTTRFYTRAGEYYVATDNAAGEIEEFKIAYTFGFTPLQQYLIELPKGRLQALSIAWDSRPAAEGGQRWYHLYPDERIDHDDPLHWTGAFQNWNSRCASCHSTDLAKNYDRAGNRYTTRWAEIAVGCESCHGPGARHLAWAAGDASIAERGLGTSLAAVWQPSAGERPSRAEAGMLSPQLQVCSACHSLRTELAHRDPGAAFADGYALSPLRDGLYFPDGQMREEVYVTGSFLQSKMHANAVSCTNCHEPHGGRLHIEGNGLCLQCHEARAFETEAHHFHEPGTIGAQCVSCHMSQRAYMGIDVRHDHSFRVPDPRASVALGVPNACTGCHTDRSDEWAAAFVTERTGRTEPRYGHAALLAAARGGDAAVAPALAAFARDADAPAILRATALLESARFPSQAHLRAVIDALGARDPLVRASAASAIGFLGPGERLQTLGGMLDDPVKSVRLAVARALIDVPAGQASGLQPRLRERLAELERSLLYNADLPEAMTELGLVYAARGELAQARDALLHALELAPRYLGALLNLADVYRALGRDDLGQPLLAAALEEYPESGDAHHALGLLYVRAGRASDSLPLFARAAELAPENAQYALVHAVALFELGRREQAIAALEAAAERFPSDSRIGNALQSYQAQPLSE